MRVWAVVGTAAAVGQLQWPCSSLALLPPAAQGCPHGIISAPSPQLPAELSFPAAAAGILLLHPKELHWVWDIPVLKGCAWIPSSQDPERVRTEGKVLGWLFCVSVGGKFSFLLSILSPAHLPPAAPLSWCLQGAALVF